MATTDKPDVTKPEASVVPSVPDAADNSPRGPEVSLSGKRLRGIPQRGGVKIQVDEADFARHGIKQGTVVFSYFKDNFTVEVGKDISQDAADFLVKYAPETYEYMN